MTNLIKLSLAVVLAIVAAGLNWMWLNQRETPPQFVMVNADITQGTRLDDTMLASVGIPGSADDLSDSFIPYAKRAILFGAVAPRDYVKGDVVLYRDMKIPWELNRYKLLGPFRLISVGQRFAASVEASDDAATFGADDNVTIAVPLPFDDKVNQLVTFVEREQSQYGLEDSEGNAGLRLIGVVSHELRQEAPADSTGSPGTSEDPPDDSGSLLGKNEGTLTVPLHNIEMAPQVLRRGEEISFVIRNTAPVE